MSDEIKRSILERYGGNDLLMNLMNRLGGSARSDVVFGNPVERESVTVIPVARVRYGVGFGFGAGSGSKDTVPASREGGGGGGGGGMSGDPIGFIEISKDGAKFIPIAAPANPATLMLFAALAAALVYGLATRKRAD